MNELPGMGPNQPRRKLADWNSVPQDETEPSIKQDAKGVRYSEV